MSIVLNNITDRPASYVPVMESQPANIIRLVEDPTVIKTIQFDEISVPDTPDPTTTQGGNIKTSELGLAFPMIRINDMILSRQNIMSMSIRQTGFIPTIDLVLVFEDTNFVSKNMPKDGDIISLYIRTDTNAITFIRCEFLITRCSVSNRSYGKMGNGVSLSGRLFIPGFESKAAVHAITGTSKNVMREVAKTYGIGFAYNDSDDTDDFMTWIQCRERTDSFLNSVTEHAWKNETSFFKSWIDLYYNLCFVNINKFMLSTENDEEVDVTFATNVLNMYNQLTVDSSVGNAMMAAKILSNIEEFMQTPFYIKKWDPLNKSTKVSLSKGYATTTYTFLHNQNMINQGDWNCFETLTNIPSYDQNKTDSFTILRGRTKYNRDKNPETEQARVNYDYIGLYNRVEWTGVEYVLSDDERNKHPNKWSGNVHKNYNRAPIHNSQNMSEFNKMYIDVYCSGLNMQILRGERIPVLLVFNNTIEQEMYNSTETDMPREYNRLYSGYYYVDSVEYSYKPMTGGETGMSPYTTMFRLKRREWPTPEIIAKDTTEQNGNS